MFQLYRSNYKNADSIVMYTRIPNTGTITTKSESIQVVFSSRCATKSKEACLTFYENEEAYRSNPSNHLKKFWGPPSNFIDTTFVNRSSLYVVFERLSFFSFNYSEYSLVSLTQLMTTPTRIPYSQEYH